MPLNVLSLGCSAVWILLESDAYLSGVQFRYSKKHPKADLQNKNRRLERAGGGDVAATHLDQFVDYFSSMKM